ncbi:MAG TPA: PadR family transcriptional regulator [Gaiellaceae bacterium]|nr:PadR family transcriptional regulator [Gaiellaceae bacterium]
MRKLTTTSYLILGLLSLRRWSTYELAQQMQRSIRYYWPRAESKIYEEPKKLVAHGLATATREYAGRRPRTVYAITDEGRQALRCWLAEPGKGPLVEFEGLIKVLFAEQAGKDELLATLASVRAEAERRRQHHAELAADLAETGGPFPERLHVNALVFKFMWEQTEMLLEWVTWAEQEVADWPSDASLPTEREPASVLREAAGLSS